MNTWCGSGVVGDDAELGRTAGGTDVAEFSLAHQVRERGKPPRTIWFQVAVYGGAAKATHEACKKGRPVWVQGRLDIVTYTNKHTGQPATMVKVEGAEVNWDWYNSRHGTKRDA